MNLPVEGGRSGRVGYPVPPGPSILDKMWERLVTETADLLDLVERDPTNNYMSGRQIGLCLGMAEMIATLLNPYNPSVNEVRAEVMRRIEERTSA